MVKNEKFQCPSERGGPEDFKTHPTFFSSAIFQGVMASQNMVNFFLGHPVGVTRCESCVINDINGEKYKREGKYDLFKTNVNFSIINII